MKNIFTLLFVFFFTGILFAQAPEKMSYQAVVRDGSNELVINQTVGMQISILQGTVSGTSVYTETQTPITNSNGLVSLEIGSGTSVSGTFSAIDWSAGPYFIKTETDPNGGINYTITGTSQLMSVPYALYAEKVGNTIWDLNIDTISTQNYVRIGARNVNDISPLHIKSLPNNATGIPIEGSSSAASNSSVRFYDESERISAIGVSLSGNSFYSRDAKVGDFIIRSEDHNMIFATSSDNNFPAALYISNNGEVGVNSSSPQRSLHINDVMRLEPRSTVPTSPSEGDIYMDAITHKLMVYDGTIWQACW